MQDLYLWHVTFSCSMQTLNCGIWNLVSWQGIKPRHLYRECTLNQWTTREVMTLETLVLSWIDLKYIKQPHHVNLTVTLPQALHFAFPDPSFLICRDQQWGDSQVPNLQASCSDPDISHISLDSHTRGLLLSLYSLEMDTHMKYTPWCDWRSTTQRNGCADHGCIAAQGRIFCSICQALWGRHLSTHSLHPGFSLYWVC